MSEKNVPRIFAFIYALDAFGGSTPGSHHTLSNSGAAKLKVSRRYLQEDLRCRWAWYGVIHRGYLYAMATAPAKAAAEPSHFDMELSEWMGTCNTTTLQETAWVDNPEVCHSSSPSTHQIARHVGCWLLVVGWLVGCWPSVSVTTHQHVHFPRTFVLRRRPDSRTHY